MMLGVLPAKTAAGLITPHYPLTDISQPHYYLQRKQDRDRCYHTPRVLLRPDHRLVFELIVDLGDATLQQPDDDQPSA